MGELALMVRKWESRPCLSQTPCGNTGERKMPSLTPHHLLQVGNMTQPLTNCSTQDNRPCVSPVQHNRVDPLDRGNGKPILRVWEAYGWYCLPCLYCCSRAKGKIPTPLTLSTSSWWERWPSPLPATTLEKTGPASHLICIELTLLVEMCVNQSQCCEHWGAVPTTHLSHCGVVGGELPANMSHLALLATDWQMKELTFPRISCCTPESKPCSLPGQQSKADLVDGGAGELALSVWERESWPHPCHLLWGDEGEEKIPPLTLPLVVEKLADTAPLPASALRWLDPAPCLGCTAELTLFTGCREN